MKKIYFKIKNKKLKDIILDHYVYIKFLIQKKVVIILVI